VATGALCRFAGAAGDTLRSLTRLGAREGSSVVSVTAHVERDSGRQIIRAPEPGAEVQEVAVAAPGTEHFAALFDTAPPVAA
jgi:hypothetical protein